MTFEQYVAHVGTSENLQREGSQGPTRVDQSGFLRERHQKLKLTEAQTAMIKWLAPSPAGPPRSSSSPRSGRQTAGATCPLWRDSPRPGASSSASSRATARR